MTSEAEELERQIVAEKDALGENIETLIHQAKELADWRTYVRKAPLPAVGISFGTSVLIGALTGRRRRRFARHESRGTRALERARQQPLRDESGPVAPSAAHDAWEIFKGAVVGLATERVASYVSELLPEFSKHLEEQRRARAGHEEAWRVRSVGADGNRLH
ncbi:MAG TPA: hypothetical protein VHE78_09660 [Gemmatimonadaceae bacterium]|nr:hypothetical protein [Gemmatimonadaceae bacterium]